MDKRPFRGRQVGLGGRVLGMLLASVISFAGCGGPAEAIGPEILSFEASTSSLEAGEAVVLSWKTAHTTSVALTANGEPVEADSLPKGEGTFRLELLEPTEFELVAKGDGESATSRLLVQVTPAIQGFTADPAVVSIGETSRLRWQTKGTTGLEILDEEGAAIHFVSSGQDEGSFEIQPTGTRTYTLVAKGKGGEARATAEVQVGPVIDVFLVEAEGVMREEMEVVLRWETRGASKLTLSRTDDFSMEIPQAEISSGSLAIPAGSGTFVLLAEHGAQQATRQVEVAVTNEPRLVDVEVGPEVTAGRGVVANVTVKWKSLGAQSVEIEAIPGGMLDLKGRLDGTIAVAISGPTTFHFVAKNAEGIHEKYLDAPVHPVPLIGAFSATPSRVAVGADVQLRWEVEDGASISLEADGGVEMDVDPSLFVGAHSVPITEVGIHRFVLRAMNGLGHTVAAEIQVRTGRPTVLSFDAEPRRADKLRPVTLLWENDGGTELRIVDEEGAPLCESRDVAEIQKGLCQVTTPGEGGWITYRIQVENEDGEGERSIQFFVGDGPIVETFKVDPQVVEVGQPVVLSWRTQDDLFQVTPAVSILDDRGVWHSAPAEDGAAGSMTLVVDQPGEHALLLRAETQGTIPFELTQIVDVVGIPVVHASAAPNRIESSGEPVEISWTTSHGAYLEVVKLDTNGNHVGAPVCTVHDSAEVASGSCVVHPTLATYHFEVSVHSRLSTVTRTTVRVDVEPATVDLFEPNTLEILRGQSVQLAWETRNGSTTTLSRSLVDSAPIDVSGNDSASNPAWVSVTENTFNSAIIEFPRGFAFPFAGVVREKVRLVNNGYLSFDFTSTGNSSPVNRSFPEPTYAHPHLAPFWSSISKSQGNVWYDLVEREQALAFQWKGYHFDVFSTLGNPSDLNFQVILWDDGEFEFRYGTMASIIPEWAAGFESVIGHQDPTGTVGTNFVNRAAYPGGLTGVVFPAKWDGLAGTGSMEVSPKHDTVYTLESRNVRGADTQSVTVIVHPNGSLFPAGPPENPLPGAEFEIDWRGFGLTSLTIEDRDGTVFCTIIAEEELEEGSCVREEPEEGVHVYTLRALGVHAQDVIEKTISVAVLPALKIDSFVAGPSAILPGASSVLSWVTTSAMEVRIEHEDGTEIMVFNGEDAESGSLVVSPGRSMTYRLVTERQGVVRTALATVGVRTATIDSFGVESTYVEPGTPKQLSWQTSQDGYLYFEDPRFSEVTADPYLDLRLSGGTQILLSPNAATLDFPQGFSFPFFGRSVESVRVTRKGYLSLDLGETGVAANSALPHTSNPLRALAVFWDNFANGEGTTWWQFVAGTGGGQDHVIVQWSDMKWAALFGGFSTKDSGNFQVALFADGSFEYRFGEMITDGKLDTTAAKGGSAVIGFQDPTAKISSTLLYRSVELGFLSGRIFRYDPPGKGLGTKNISPTESENYRLCILGEGWKECQDQRVVVVEPGDLVVSEIMAEPTGGAAKWFEIRNLAPDPLPLGEMVLHMNGNAHPLQAIDPAWLEPGGYMVFSDGPSPSLGDPYVFPAALAMGRTGNLSITYGNTSVASQSWDGSLPFVPGASIELDPTRHIRRSDPFSASDWCTSLVAYGGGNAGTPGDHGATCTSVHYDVDWLSPMPFIDISPTGTQEPLLSVAIKTTPLGTLGFTMPFFDDVVDQVWGSSAGWLSFGDYTLGYNSVFPFPKTQNPNKGTVAPFWMRLEAQPVLYGTPNLFHHERRSVDGLEVAIFQWTNYRIGSFGSITMQVQLWENGDIVMAYGDIHGHGPAYKGSLASIGMDNVGGTIGLTYLFKQPILSPGQTLHFRYKG